MLDDCDFLKILSLALPAAVMMGRDFKKKDKDDRR
jgi:hypothetical protein